LPFEEYLGLVAGLLTSTSLVPQIIRVFRLKSAREISLLFTLVMLTGVLLWLAYGIILDRLPLILWNSIGALFLIILLGTKLKYGRQAPGK
jgi:MtN3 and saliva related transmembrane protein